MERPVVLHRRQNAIRAGDERLPGESRPYFRWLAVALDAYDLATVGCCDKRPQAHTAAVVERDGIRADGRRAPAPELA